MRYISWFTRHGCDISGSKNRRVESGYRWQANQIRAHCTWYRLQLWSESIAHIVTGTRATSGHDNHRYSRAFAHHESIGTAALCARESSVPRMPLVDANKRDSNRFERESNALTLHFYARIFRTNDPQGRFRTAHRSKGCRIWTALHSRYVMCQRQRSRSEKKQHFYFVKIINKIANVIFYN